MWRSKNRAGKRSQPVTIRSRTGPSSATAADRDLSPERSTPCRGGSFSRSGRRSCTCASTATGWRLFSRRAANTIPSRRTSRICCGSSGGASPTPKSRRSSASPPPRYAPAVSLPGAGKAGEILPRGLPSRARRGRPRRGGDRPCARRCEDGGRTVRSD